MRVQEIDERPDGSCRVANRVNGAWPVAVHYFRFAPFSKLWLILNLTDAIIRECGILFRSRFFGLFTSAR